MSCNKTSRAGLVLCLVGSLTLSGCANGGWSRLLGRNNDKPSASLTLAWSRLKEDEGSLTEARSGYEKVLSDQPNSVDAILGMARLNVKAQRLVDAEQGFVRALELQPKAPVVLSEVGKFYAQQQRWDKAIPLLQEAQRIEPHEKSHQFALGATLAQAGRDAEAIPHFTDAVGEAAAHYNVGRILIESGKTAEAEQHFTVALAKDPKLTDAEYFLSEIRSGRQGTLPSGSIVADGGAKSATQQVSGAVPQSHSAVKPVTTASASGRTPIVPHVGYEELPPPPDAGSDPFATGITPASGFSPPVSTTAVPQPSPPAGNGAQLRLSTTHQVPLR